MRLAQDAVALAVVSCALLACPADPGGEGSLADATPAAEEGASAGPEGDAVQAGGSEDSLSLIARARERLLSARDQPRESPAFDAALQEAGQLLQQGRYDEVVKRLEPVVQEDGNDRARLFLALAHHKSKRYAQARPLFEEILAGPLDFDKAEGTLYYYGYCLYYLGEPAAGKAAFEAFLDVAQREDDDAHFGIGLCAIELGELDTAKEHLNRSLEIIERLGRQDPRRRPALARPFAKAHARLGDIAALEDDLEAARKHYEECLGAYPMAHEVWFSLARVCDRLGLAERAEEARKAHDYYKRLAQQSRVGPGAAVEEDAGG